MNIILLASTATVTCIHLCKEAQLVASATRQRATQAKAVSVAVQYVRKATSQQCSYTARGEETPRAVPAVLTSFMVKTTEARRGEPPSSEGGKKEKEKEKKRLSKERVKV